MNVVITVCDKFIKHAVNTATSLSHSDGLCSFVLYFGHGFQIISVLRI